MHKALKCSLELGLNSVSIHDWILQVAKSYALLPVDLI